MDGMEERKRGFPSVLREVTSSEGGLPQLKRCLASKQVYRIVNFNSLQVRIVIMKHCLSTTKLPIIKFFLGKLSNVWKKYFEKTLGVELVWLPVSRNLPFASPRKNWGGWGRREKGLTGGNRKGQAAEPCLTESNRPLVPRASRRKMPNGRPFRMLVERLQCKPLLSPPVKPLGTS